MLADWESEEPAVGGKEDPLPSGTSFSYRDRSTLTASSRGGWAGGELRAPWGELHRGGDALLRHDDGAGGRSPPAAGGATAVGTGTATVSE